MQELYSKSRNWSIYETKDIIRKRDFILLSTDDQKMKNIGVKRIVDMEGELNKTTWIRILKSYLENIGLRVNEITNNKDAIKYNVNKDQYTKDNVFVCFSKF